MLPIIQFSISELQHNFSGEAPVGNSTSDTQGNLFPLLVPQNRYRSCTEKLSITDNSQHWQVNKIQRFNILKH